VAVADVYDALISERPYKHAWPPEEAIAEIMRLRGKHLDPGIVDAFVHLYDTNVLRDLDAGARDAGDDGLAAVAA
jgi:putative two-component system response regulator